MNKIMIFIAQCLGVVVMFGVFIFGSFLTIHLSTVIFPGRVLEPILSLLLFDAGFVWWVLSFAFVSKGIPQRALSIIMAIFSFIGMSLTTVGDILMGGQQVTQVNQILGFELGSIMVLVYIIWSIVNIAFGAIHFMVHPDIMAMIWREVQEDESRELAQKAAQTLRQSTDRQLAPRVGADIHNRMRRGESPNIQEGYSRAWQEEDGGREPVRPAVVVVDGGNGNGHGGNRPKSDRLP